MREVRGGGFDGGLREEGEVSAAGEEKTVERLTVLLDELCEGGRVERVAIEDGSRGCSLASHLLSLLPDRPHHRVATSAPHHLHQDAVIQSRRATSSDLIRLTRLEESKRPWEDSRSAG